jgi:hypothetical protein
VAPTSGALADASDAASVRVSGLEPAGADIPPLPAVSSNSVTTYGASSSGLSKELLAGAGAALAVLLLVLRRRKGSRKRR